ncbi:ubiquitin-activating E1 FCCH domain-containing protein [Kluyvera ascorbata]|uniref:ubiquitin-activating E1 FCCH domain-containing protein n=1 Tax=Kluyvera ascorbata TaxID=51288 RepID=UPI000DF8A072|nr:ubiquitin-activating E1 FCCH domain-containing protein [Kluyvera ascorbata]STW99498.1 Baseplate J-like protein [Kluyvera ascorbata]STX01475.1 Baseplate J-like protein [Kluyvera ascorbata]
MSDLPVIYDESGPVPQTAEELRAQIVSLATTMAPGITTELPGSLIEDMVSTSTGGAIVCDQARVDLLNSVGPLAANISLLNLLSQQYGVPGQKSEGLTTVPVSFTGPAGFAIPQGFLVSDGNYQYAVDDATIIPSSGTTSPVTCNATVSGVWAVPAGTVTNIATSLPADITLTCTNLTAGIPGSETETVPEFRARVWDAGMRTVQGYPGFIRTELNAVENIVARLTSVVQDGEHWVIMCGGGDIYSMAGAIYKAAGDISRLKGSSLNVTGISNASPGVVTTDLTHGFSSGQVARITGANGITGVNDVDLTVTVITPHTFSIGIDTSSSGAWTSGGEVTPNLRNQTVTINDWPDNYAIPFVTPLQQLVTITYQWRTEGVNYLTDATILSLVSTPTINYINGIYSGKPLNINTLKDVFLDAVNSTLNKDLFSVLNVVVTVNGTITDVDANTNIISGDPYSYWFIPDDGVYVSGA